MRRRLRVAACSVNLAIPQQFPLHRQRIALRICRLQRQPHRRARLEKRTTLSACELQRFDHRTTVRRRPARPKLRQHIRRAQPRIVRQQDGEPRRRHLLLLPPHKSIRSQTHTRVPCHRTAIRLPVPLPLRRTRQLPKRAHLILLHLPDPRRAKLRQQIRLRPAQLRIPRPHRLPARIRINPQHIHIRAQRVKISHLPPAKLRHHRHHRMLPIQRLHHPRQIINLRPHRAIRTLRILHLIPQRPRQQSRMMLVLHHRRPDRLPLLDQTRRIRPIEPLPHLPQPNPRRDRQPQLLRAVQLLPQLLMSPRAHRISARLRQQLPRTLPAHTLHKIRLPIPQQRPPPRPSLPSSPTSARMNSCRWPGPR